MLSLTTNTLLVTVCDIMGVLLISETRDRLVAGRLFHRQRGVIRLVEIGFASAARLLRRGGWQRGLVGRGGDVVRGYVTGLAVRVEHAAVAVTPLDHRDHLVLLQPQVGARWLR